MTTIQERLQSVSIDDVRAAHLRIKGRVTRTPLLRFYPDNFDGEIYLKLENLQPIGSFKLRGACNAMSLADPSLLSNGVYTASAGNMAQGVAWMAREMKISCTVIVPDHAPQTKLDAITRLGAKYIKIPFNDWWQVIMTREFEGMNGFFVHPVADPHVIAGIKAVLDRGPDLNFVAVWNAAFLPSDELPERLSEAIRRTRLP